MLELNPYLVMKRLWQGGSTPRLEWWDESSVKPIAGDSKDWWKAGPLRLIAEYPDQRSEIKISKPVDAEFIVASELRYVPKNSGTADVMRVEYNQYEGSNPYWPTIIIVYPALDSDDLFKIDYDGPPKIIAGTKKQGPN
jgi:hypothetical protein